MKIIIGSDHGGFDLKEYIKNIDFSKLINKKVEIEDVGTFNKDSCHYPEFSKKVVEKLLNEKLVSSNPADEVENFGILVCTTGIGMSISANRNKSIRASLVHFPEEAHLTRQHNNSNILCLGAKFTKTEDVEAILKEFLTTKFDGGRHLERIKMYC